MHAEWFSRMNLSEQNDILYISLSIYSFISM